MVAIIPQTRFTNNSLLSSALDWSIGGGSKGELEPCFQGLIDSAAFCLDLFIIVDGALI